MKITLPDKSVRELEDGSTGYDLAKDIGPGLAKSAVALKIDGEKHDLNDVIEKDSSVSIITIDSDDGEIRLKSSADFETKNSYNWRCRFYRFPFSKKT